MNPKLLKLLNAINAKKEEVKKFCTEDKLDEAEVAKEELKQMTNKFILIDIHTFLLIAHTILERK